MDQPSNPPAPVRLRWYGHTDRGKVRKNNEDTFLGLQFDAREFHLLGKLGDDALAEMDFVFAVSDGMGGEAAGEFASRITVEKLTRLLPRLFKQSAAGIAAGFEDALTEVFDQVHRALVYLGGSYEECSGMGATLSLCWFTPGSMHFAHIGDSRIYYLPRGCSDIVQVSHDDTHVGWLYRNKKLNEREARTHPRRNVLQKALGAGNQFVEPQVGAVLFEKGDVFLLCTDGVVDGLFDSQLAEILRHSESAPDENRARLLVNAAVEQSGRDNTTAMIVEVL
jgi:protein phosphatase